MRYLLTVVLLLGLICQGIMPAAAAAPVVKADKSYYDVNTGLFILSGNVYIEFRNQKITAGQAKASMGTMEIWGSGGVTFTLDDMYVTADSVQVISAQSRALIGGGVGFRRGDLAIAADRVELDWDKSLARFEGNVRLSKGDEACTADCLVYNIQTSTWQ